ncbi:MAG: hypothetical protein HRU15_17990 [Planctomycetes bacterium]|nr:hypothetical protein [Planctomycetota bacterium]
MLRVYLLLVCCLCAVSLDAATHKVLLLRSDVVQFKEVAESIAVGLDTELELIEYILGPQEGYQDIAARIDAVNPQIIIALDNKILNHVEQYQKNKQELSAPVIGAMALDVSGRYAHMKNFCAIRFEVPGYVVVKGYMEMAEIELNEVLVIYRSSVSAQRIEQARRQLARENIHLRAIDIDTIAKSERRLKQYLQRDLPRLVKDEKVDAVWVMEDNGLINRTTLGLWLELARTQRKPFLSGLDVFASNDMDFCTYVASPRRSELGGQISNIAASIVLDGLKVQKIGIEDNISYRHIFNLKHARRMRIEDTIRSKEIIDIAD